MKCELCSSGQREHGRRLCLPCMEAVARLWKIVCSEATQAAGQTLTRPAAIQTKYVPIIAGAQLRWPTRMP